VTLGNPVFNGCFTGNIIQKNERFLVVEIERLTHWIFINFHRLEEVLLQKQELMIMTMTMLMMMVVVC
jgi:hypothetical protein